MEELVEIRFENIYACRFILLALISISSVMYYARTRSKKVKLPPGPPWIPLLGSIPWIDKKNPAKTLTEWAHRYGPIYMFYMGRKRTIIVSDARLARELLLKHSDVFSARADVLPTRVSWGVKGGVLLENGEDWKTHRRWVVTGLRHFGVGKRSLEEQIITEGRELCNQIEKEDGKFNPLKYITNAVSNIICSISFGKRYEYNDPEFQELLGNVSELFNNSLFGRIAFIMPFFLRFIVKRKQSVANITQFINQHIKEHKETFDEGNIRDLIDMILLQAKEKLSNGEALTEAAYITNGVARMPSNKPAYRGTKSVPDDVDSLWRAIAMLFLAGSDTTMNTILWFLLYMISYPAVQKRVQDEIDNATNGERPLTIQDKPNVPYFEATICEVQRLGSVAPRLLPHSTTADFSINGYVIPANTNFNLPLDVIHTDPKYWKDPHAFKPERFLDKDERIFIRREAFMPFGIGRRMCLGDNLAKMELYIFLSSLLQRFTFELPASSPQPCFEPVVGVTLSPCSFEILGKPR